jgi:hypothetical protein
MWGSATVRFVCGYEILQSSETGEFRGPIEQHFGIAEPDRSQFFKKVLPEMIEAKSTRLIQWVEVILRRRQMLDRSIRLDDCACYGGCR